MAHPPPDDIPTSPHYPLYDVLDMTTGSWQSLAPLELEFLASALMIGGDLYAIGLESDYDNTASDPVLLNAELVVARYTPTSAHEGSASDPGGGGCGG